MNDLNELLKNRTEQNRNEPKENLLEIRSLERIERLKAKPNVTSPDASRMLELRRAVQMFLSTLDADTQAAAMMEVASVFPRYEVGKAYKTKDVFSFGENGVGDPQLYQVLQTHTSAAEWAPDATPSLYKAIGVTENGYPEWVQPICATDAYELDNMVMHNGKLWLCTDVDAGGKNSWEPGVYGWTEVTE